MRFTQGYAAASICSPSRVALMSGKYPARLHTTNYFTGKREGRLIPPQFRNYLPVEEVTIAEALKAQGYKTAVAGKWHLGPQSTPAPHPSQHGFDVVIGFGTKPSTGPKDDPHRARQFATELAKFIKDCGDQPFFVYMALHSVHIPIKGRPTLVEKNTQKAAALPPRQGPVEVQVGNHTMRLVQDHAAYAAMVQEMDEAVGLLVDKIDQLKLTDRTRVLFTSDNGGLSVAQGTPTSNLPLRAGKSYLYEGGVRVALKMAAKRMGPKPHA